MKRARRRRLSGIEAASVEYDWMNVVQRVFEECGVRATTMPICYTQRSLQSISRSVSCIESQNYTQHTFKVQTKHTAQTNDRNVKLPNTVRAISIAIVLKSATRCQLPWVDFDDDFLSLDKTFAGLMNQLQNRTVVHGRRRGIAQFTVQPRTRRYFQE